MEYKGILVGSSGAITQSSQWSGDSVSELLNEIREDDACHWGDPKALGDYAFPAVVQTNEPFADDDSIIVKVGGIQIDDKDLEFDFGLITVGDFREWCKTGGKLFVESILTLNLCPHCEGKGCSECGGLGAA